MTYPTPLDLRTERDEFRSKLEPLQEENKRLRMLLDYAEAAIMDYYHRMYSAEDKSK